MKDELISFETAKLAKEKGLKLNFCREIFHTSPHNSKEFIPTEMIHDWELIENKDWYSRPTQSLLQRWLREVHNIDVWAQPFEFRRSLRDESYCYILYKSNVWITDRVEFIDFEEALEAGLIEALNLINIKLC